MKVTIGKRVWEMSKTKYKGLLDIASGQVPFGVYAIEKNGVAELRHDHCKSRSELKKLKQSFKRMGYKVYANGL